MSERFVPSRLSSFALGRFAGVVLAAAALSLAAPLSALADNDHHGHGRSHGKHYGKHYGKHGGNHYGYGHGYYAPPVYYGPPPWARPRRVNVYNYYPVAVPVPIPVTRGPNVVVHIGADWVLGY